MSPRPKKWHPIQLGNSLVPGPLFHRWRHLAFSSGTISFTFFVSDRGRHCVHVAVLSRHLADHMGTDTWILSAFIFHMVFKHFLFTISVYKSIYVTNRAAFRVHFRFGNFLCSGCRAFGIGDKNDPRQIQPMRAVLWIANGGSLWGPPFCLRFQPIRVLCSIANGGSLWRPPCARPPNAIFEFSPSPQHDWKLIMLHQILPA